MEIAKAEALYLNGKHTYKMLLLKFAESLQCHFFFNYRLWSICLGMERFFNPILNVISQYMSFE